MIHMKCQTLFYLKNRKKKYFKVLSATVMISPLTANLSHSRGYFCYFSLLLHGKHTLQHLRGFQGDWIHSVDFPLFCTTKTTFVTSCLLSCTSKVPSEKMVTPFRMAPFRMEAKQL